MLVKVRHGFSVKINEEAFSEDTLLEVSQREYQENHNVLEKVFPRNEAEKVFYEEKAKELGEGKRVITTKKVMVTLRNGYAYVNPNTGKLVASGESFELPELEYFMRHWIFDVVEGKYPEKISESTAYEEIDGHTIGGVSVPAFVPVTTGNQSELDNTEGSDAVVAEEDEEEKKSKAMSTKKHRAILRTQKVKAK